MIKVWDIGVRLFHWSLLTCFAAAYFLSGQRDWHVLFGYAVAGLVGFRIVWGLIGNKHARFLDFVPGPIKLLKYLYAMVRGTEPRTLGHNPAGGVMIIALLTCLIGICTTGYMMGMDAYFGEDWVEELHRTLVNGMLLLILFHVSGVVFSSLRHKENLVKAMITGFKSARAA
jgi:cytochrome b